MWPGSTAPSGWVLCNGYGIPLSNYQDVIVRDGYEEYQNLATLLKERKSSGPYFDIKTGEASTPSIYVPVPDFGQRFPLGAKEDGTIGKFGTGTSVDGWSTSLGQRGGTSVQRLSVDEMPTHSHDLILGEAGSATAGTYYALEVMSNGLDVMATKTDDTTAPDYFHSTLSGQTVDSQGGAIQTTGGSVVHNNIPPFLAINFIIKYK
jgi:microcystin-dependent protein